jgi:hypothetical protein
MERREFLKLLFTGVGAAAAAAAAPADVFASLAPLAEPDRNPDLATRPAVAASEDVDGAQVQKAHYYYHPYYRHRRRVYRRYRRRYYY